MGWMALLKRMGASTRPLHMNPGRTRPRAWAVRSRQRVTSNTSEPGENDADRYSTSLAAVVTVLIVLIMSLVIVREPQVRSILQECRLSQRTLCETTADRLRVNC